MRCLEVITHAHNKKKDEQTESIQLFLDPQENWCQGNLLSSRMKRVRKSANHNWWKFSVSMGTKERTPKLQLMNFWRLSVEKFEIKSLQETPFLKKSLHWQPAQDQTQVQDPRLKPHGWPPLSCTCLGLTFPAMYLNITGLTSITSLHYHGHVHVRYCSQRSVLL